MEDRNLERRIRDAKNHLDMNASLMDHLVERIEELEAELIKAQNRIEELENEKT